MAPPSLVAILALLAAAAAATPEERAGKLLAEMTLEEKLSMLHGPPGGDLYETLLEGRNWLRED